MTRIRKLLSLLFVAAWAVGEAPRLWFGDWPIRPMDAAAGGLAGFRLLVTMMNKNYKNYIHKNKKILAIAGVLATSWVLGLRLWSAGEALPGLLYLLRTLIYFWLIYRADEIFGQVRRWIPAALGAFLVLGLGQYVFLPDTRFLLRYGWDEHYWRLIGTVLDPNYMGVMAGMILFYFLNKSYNGYKFNKQLLIILLALAVLVLTWSRASWVSVLVAGGWWLVAGKNNWRKRLGLVGALGVLGLGVWWAAPKPGGEGVNLGRTASIEQRRVSWDKAMEVWKQHPWLGVGFNNYGVGSMGHVNSPSSSWLLLVSTLGIVGTTGIIIGGIRGIREIGAGREKQFWLGIIMMISIHAIFNNTLFYPPVLGLAAMMRIIAAR
jgi:O-antigen ligase